MTLTEHYRRAEQLLANIEGAAMQRPDAPTDPLVGALVAVGHALLASIPSPPGGRL